MSFHLKPALVTPSVRAAAAAMGVVVGGPAGGIIGGFVGGYLLGPAAAVVVVELAKHIGERAGEKFLDSSAESILDSLKAEGTFGLEQAYRDSLRIALSNVSDKSGYEEWFKNWISCLKRNVRLALTPMRKTEPQEVPVTPVLIPDDVDEFLCEALITLDAQQRAFAAGSTSISLVRFERLPFPMPLLHTLKRELPVLLEETFSELIVKSEYQEALNSVVLKLLRHSSALTLRVYEIATLTADKVMHIDTAAAAIQGDVTTVLVQQSQGLQRQDEQFGKINTILNELLALRTAAPSPGTKTIRRELVDQSHEPARLRRLKMSGSLGAASRVFIQAGLLSTALSQVVEIHQGLVVPILGEIEGISQQVKFADTQELVRISGEINAHAFSSQRWRGTGNGFVSNRKEKIERNRLHARRNKYSLLLLKAFPFPGLSPLDDYIGFSHVLPLTEEGHLLYLEGKLPDNHCWPQYICKPTARPRSLLIFSIAVDGFRSIKNVYRHTSGDLRKSDDFRYRVAQLLIQGLAYHIHFLMKLYGSDGRPIELIVQTDESIDVVCALKMAGFKPTKSESADKCRIWSAVARLNAC